MSHDPQLVVTVNVRGGHKDTAVQNGDVTIEEGIKRFAASFFAIKQQADEVEVEWHRLDNANGKETSGTATVRKAEQFVISGLRGSDD